MRWATSTGTSKTKRYGMATLLAIASLGLRWLIQSIVRDQVPFITAYPAVLLAARCYGLGPALLTTVLGGAGGFVLTGHASVVRLLLYLAVSGFSIHVIELLRHANLRAEENARLLAES